MKLWKCPAIVGRFEDNLTLTTIAMAAAKVRCHYDTAPCDTSGSLRKVAQDIWAHDKPIGLHKDNTRAGYWVFGVVLINDGGLLLSANSVLYDLPVGTIYAIDGRKLHGALAHNAIKPGLFGFLAWDVDKRTEVQELIDAFQDSLAAWVAGEERIDVS